MVHLIDKAAVVAEINRVLNSYDPNEITSGRYALVDLRDFIDTLEVKDMSMPALDNGNMPVERWKEACEAASCQANYRKSKGLTETCDDYFVDGVQWADEHPKEEPISEELEEAVNAYIGYAPEVDESSSTYGKRQAFKAGAKWQKEQMMKDATDVTVHIDAGGYPYIPQMELYDYDYDNDVPLAKEGDKYKVVLIKEE